MVVDVAAMQNHEDLHQKVTVRLASIVYSNHFCYNIPVVMKLVASCAPGDLRCILRTYIVPRPEFLSFAAYATLSLSPHIVVACS